MPCLQVSKLVAELLAQKSSSPSSGESGMAMSVNVGSRTPVGKRTLGRKEFVSMQVSSEVMSLPQKPEILYRREDTVSKEEADLHGET